MTERTLAIDCATPALSLALFDGDECISARHDVIGRGHAEALVPAIAALPGQGRADAILVNVGPGSFTGVRVGLAAARALGYAWRAPVHGYGCLDVVAAMARELYAPVGSFAVVMVGGHGELFWQIFASDDDGILSSEAELCSTPIDLLASMLNDVAIFGSGGDAVLKAREQAGLSDINATFLLPDARYCQLLPSLARNRPPRPVYGRGADAKPMITAEPNAQS